MILFDTDKHEHGLIDFYDNLFKDLKSKPITLLELGVLRGGSLLYWNDYFDNAQIVGIDINPIDLPNIPVYKAEQTNKERLDKIAKNHGLFDIIIDDCSHIYEKTQASFDILYKYVKPGGMYIVEDWATGLNLGGQYLGLEKIVTNAIVNMSVKEVRAVKLEKGSVAVFYKK